MENDKMSFYALGFAVAVLENVRSVVAVSAHYEHFKDMSGENWNKFMEEFLFYDLHVCDRLVFFWFGAQERDRMMSEIIARIALISEKGSGTVVSEKLKDLVSDEFTQYLKGESGVSLYDALVDSYNQRLREYAPLKFIKEREQDNPADLLYQAFALKISFLLGHPRNEFLKAHIINFAAGVYKLMTSTKEILDKHWGATE